MTTEAVIRLFAILHGMLHVLVFCGLVYQGWLGFRIQRGRRAGSPQFSVVKKHRKFGPILIFIAVIGYLWGLVLVSVDERNLFQFPLHLFCGSLAVFLLLVQYTISTAIRGSQSQWRTPHSYMGVVTLCVYGIQLIIGAGILF